MAIKQAKNGLHVLDNLGLATANPILLKNLCNKGNLQRLSQFFGDALLNKLSFNLYSNFSLNRPKGYCIANHIFISKALLADQNQLLQVLAHEIAHALQFKAWWGKDISKARPEFFFSETLEREADGIAKKISQRQPSDLAVSQVAYSKHSWPVLGYRDILANQFAVNNIVVADDVIFPGHQAANPSTDDSAFFTLNAPRQLNRVSRTKATTLVNNTPLKLIISNDWQIAMEHTENDVRQVKTFFATEQVINDSNAALRKIKLPTDGGIYLGKQVLAGTNTITIKGKTLHRCCVMKNNAAVPDIGPNCNDCPMSLVGVDERHGVLVHKQGRVKKFDMNKFGWENFVAAYFYGLVMGSEQIAEDMLKSAIDLVSRIGPPSPKNPKPFQPIDSIGLDYGSLLAIIKGVKNPIDRNAVIRKYKQLAATYNINEYAVADVGNAYKTCSIGFFDKHGNSHDYATETDINPVWDMHWGTVIAKATDGEDAIMYENYARTNLPSGANGAEMSFYRMVRLKADSARDYNSKSWHERNAEGFVNPITFVIKNPRS
ncbi:MAG: hypothetical protein WC782_08590 [Methylococcaceae bacterium]|jgi:hypothetical protein